MDTIPADLNLNHTIKVSRILPLAMVALGFLLLNAGVLSDMVTLWFTRPHSHGQGILILLVWLYMLAKQRPQLRKIPVNPSIGWGALVLSAACAVLLVGQLTQTVTAQQSASILSLMGFILLVLGWRHLKALFLSIGYLIFMFPIVGTILSSKVILLQKVTATIAAGLLDAVGFSVFKQGHLIQLPHITLDVVAACSGINHIVSLVAIAIPLAVMSDLKTWGKVLLISGAVVIGIFANGLRVGLIGVWTHLFRGANVHGPADFLLISFVLVFGMTVLLLGWCLITRVQGQRRPAEKEAGEGETFHSMAGLTIKSPAVVTALALSFSFTGLSWFYETRPVKIEENFDPLPASIEEWHGQTQAVIDPRLSMPGADQVWFKKYRSADNLWAYACMGYYEKQSEGREVFGSGVRKLFTNARQVTQVEFTTSWIGFSFDSNFDGLAAYLVDGRFYDVAAAAKSANLRNTLLNRRNNAAILILLYPKGGRIGMYRSLINTLVAHNSANVP